MNQSRHWNSRGRRRSGRGGCGERGARGIVIDPLDDSLIDEPGDSGYVVQVDLAARASGDQLGGYPALGKPQHIDV